MLFRAARPRPPPPLTPVPPSPQRADPLPMITDRFEVYAPDGPFRIECPKRTPLGANTAFLPHSEEFENGRPLPASTSDPSIRSSAPLLSTPMSTLWARVHAHEREALARRSPHSHRDDGAGGSGRNATTATPVEEEEEEEDDDDDDHREDAAPNHGDGNDDVDMDLDVEKSTRKTTPPTTFVPRAIWSEKYAVSHYRDLLGAEKVNRGVLFWAKSFRAHGSGGVKDGGDRGDADISLPRAVMEGAALVADPSTHIHHPYPVAILCGPASSGKSTLARVVGHQAGYRVVTIRGCGDEVHHGGTTPSALAQAAIHTTSHSTLLRDKRPACAVVDDLDGSTPQGLKHARSVAAALVKQIESYSSSKRKKKDGPEEGRDDLGHGANGALHDGGGVEARSNRSSGGPVRPLLVVVGDATASAFGGLRGCVVFSVPMPTYASVLTRLRTVADLERVACEARALALLNERTGGDIRAALNLLQLAHRRHAGHLTVLLVERLTAGLRDHHPTVFQMWDDLFGVRTLSSASSWAATTTSTPHGGGDRDTSTSTPGSSTSIVPHHHPWLTGAPPDASDFPLLLSGCFENFNPTQCRHLNMEAWPETSALLSQLDLLASQHQFNYLPAALLSFRRRVAPITSRNTASPRFPFADIAAERRADHHAQILGHFQGARSTATATSRSYRTLSSHEATVTSRGGTLPASLQALNHPTTFSHAQSHLETKKGRGHVSAHVGQWSSEVVPVVMWSLAPVLRPVPAALMTPDELHAVNHMVSLMTNLELSYAAEPHAVDDTSAKGGGGGTFGSKRRWSGSTSDHSHPSRHSRHDQHMTTTHVALWPPIDTLHCYNGAPPRGRSVDPAVQSLVRQLMATVAARQEHEAYLESHPDHHETSAFATPSKAKRRRTSGGVGSTPTRTTPRRSPRIRSASKRSASDMKNDGLAARRAAAMMMGATGTEMKKGEGEGQKGKRRATSWFDEARTQAALKAAQRRGGGGGGGNRQEDGEGETRGEGGESHGRLMRHQHQVTYMYNEGLTNAVRRPLMLKDLLG